MLIFIVTLLYLLTLIPAGHLIYRLSSEEKREEVSDGEGKKKIGLTLGGIIFLSLVLWYSGIYTESLWFSSLGYDSVFWTRLGTQWALFAFFGAITLLIILANVWLLKRILNPALTGEYDHQVFKWVAFSVSGLIAYVFALIAMGQWEKFLLFFNQVPSGVVDPIFQKDISFYFFSLPVQDYISTIILAVWIVIGVAICIIYGIYINVDKNQRYEGYFGFRTDQQEKEIKTSLYDFIKRCVNHLVIWGAGFFLILIWKFILARYHLLTDSGLVPGASFIDVNFRIPAYGAMVGVAIAVILVLLATLFWKKWKWKIQISTTGSFFIVWLVMLVIIPSWIIWPLSVKPNELEKETLYLEYSISGTRQAYGLGEIEEKEFNYEAVASPEVLARNQDTLENIRLWDWRPLISSYQQMQRFTLYYEYSDVDIDRYMVNGEYRQVMLAAREMKKSNLDQRSQTWINQRFKYTHGYGTVLNKVNEFGESGMPNFLVKDIPPQSSVQEISVTRPEIYYGELTDDHVIVKTTEQEFDYPGKEQNMFCDYQGNGGVEIKGGLRKLALAWRFDGIKLYTSSPIKPDSRIMFYRQIKERVKIIAPFLKYDQDPYLVIDSQGKLWWLADAYTVSSEYPYSESYKGKFNYIRNSVKITIDPYDGSVTFYVFDETDPIIKTYQRSFPALFQPKSEMPQDLMSHVRYPEDLISIQANIYRAYHMTDPKAFYNKEDFWEIAQEIHAMGQKQEVIPYYVIIRLPGESEEEFVQMIPFTPKAEDRNNLVGWLAGRSDRENYGKLLAIRFPRQVTIFGPMQFEARIDQNEQMSRDFSLWGQGGSDVIRGNTLVIPIENTILYVEPVYIKAEQGQMPEIKKVIVAMGDRLEWGDTFDEALKKVTGAVLKIPMEPKPGGEPAVTDKDQQLEKIETLLEELLKAFKTYKEGK